MRSLGAVLSLLDVCTDAVDLLARLSQLSLHRFGHGLVRLLPDAIDTTTSPRNELPAEVFEAPGLLASPPPSGSSSIAPPSRRLPTWPP